MTFRQRFARALRRASRRVDPPGPVVLRLSVEMGRASIDAMNRASRSRGS